MHKECRLFIKDFGRYILSTWSKSSLTKLGIMWVCDLNERHSLRLFPNFAPGGVVRIALDYNRPHARFPQYILHSSDEHTNRKFEYTVLPEELEIVAPWINKVYRHLHTHLDTPFPPSPVEQHEGPNWNPYDYGWSERAWNVDPKREEKHKKG